MPTQADAIKHGPEPHEVAISKRRLVLILGLLTAFGAFSIDMYLPGIPTIAGEFKADVAALQGTLASFFLGLSLGQMIYGPLSDRLGRRPPLLFGCALYSLACIGCAFASSVEMLVGMRFVQALGGCAGMVIGRSVVRDLYDLQGTARMFSLLMLVFGLAPITAPYIGGQILVHFGWRTIFAFLCAFGVICFCLVFFWLPETVPHQNRRRLGPAEVFALYGRLLVDRRFIGYALVSSLTAGVLFTYICGSPFVFIELNGIRPERYGLIFGTNSVGLILSAQFNRFLLSRHGSARILGWALRAMTASAILLAVFTVTNVGGFPVMLVLLFCCISSMGLVQPNAMAVGLAHYRVDAGSASALMGAMQPAVGALVGVLIGLLHNGTALPMVGIIAVFAVAALLILTFFTVAPDSSAEPHRR